MGSGTVQSVTKSPELSRDLKITRMKLAPDFSNPAERFTVRDNANIPGTMTRLPKSPMKTGSCSSLVSLVAVQNSTISESEKITFF
jgi:hypothetical protein